MNGQPMNVAMALSILMSELNDNPFKGLICTFSEKPEFVSLNPKAPLRERLFTLSAANWSMNTNYQKVFDLILEKAVSNNLAKDQMIRKMVVFSDMQFDESCGRTKTDHQLIREKFERHGYTVPEIVYWNLNGTFNTVPVTKNEQGVALLSGFSASLLRLLTQTSSFSVEALIDASIQKPRYECLVLED
ncbi:hypothetical protein C9374_004348 [Naegleria lovaniensis]|uniref:DUF7788 domain-containing protein n=1 Tax=Naegleria lovaniensis TaxID=51637 RepID=A0AA88GSR6_NAELO|nr:uncharacterized protein C9374_004348 [Naegleria lovaniensis]KAG2383677.1 hypothetical protein C9374_004348 [Naegleria lovaniensis]